MNFRQRVAWLMVGFFLVATCALVYYIFDVSVSYNDLALEHVEKYHKDKGRGSEESLFSFAIGHITDIPLPVWMMFFALPYLQVFCLLIACTKPEPKFSLAILWPVYLYFKCRQLITRHQSHPKKAVNSPVSNGHILIDT
jgi:hypothetical protein